MRYADFISASLESLLEDLNEKLATSQQLVGSLRLELHKLGELKETDRLTEIEADIKVQAQHRDLARKEWEAER